MPYVNKIPGSLGYAPPGATLGGVDPYADTQLMDSLDGVTAALNGLSLTLPTTPMLKEPSELGNVRWLLGAGHHAGAETAIGGVGSIEGSSLQAVISNVVRCTPGSHTIISGVEFDGSEIGDESMLVVQAGARVIVRDCVFARGKTSIRPPIHVNSGGKLLLAGCVFTGMGTTSNYVLSHPGLPASVFASYCFNLTPNVFHDPAPTVTSLGILS